MSWFDVVPRSRSKNRLQCSDTFFFAILTVIFGLIFPPVSHLDLPAVLEFDTMRLLIDTGCDPQRKQLFEGFRH